MKPLSAETRARIEELQTLLLPRRASVEHPELLRRIAASGEPAAVPHLVVFVFGPPEERAAAAASAVEQLMRGVSVPDLPAIDEQLRPSCYSMVQKPPEWRALRPEGLERLRRFGTAYPWLLGLAASHPSGYVREAAVRELDELDSGVELPFLLLRLNDWVPQVRQAALAALEKRLTDAYAPHFVRALALVERLSRQSRVSRLEIEERIRRLLQREENRRVLLDALGSPDPRISRFAFDGAVTAPAADRKLVLSYARRSADPWTRLRAARWCAVVYEGEVLRQVLDSLRRDRSMPVRREALTAFFESFPGEAQAELEKALLDRHPSIRWLARCRLTEQGFREFAAVYRDALQTASGRDLLAAIDGLRETGSAVDADCILPFWSHERPGVRRAAIRALAALDGDAHLPRFLEALEDGLPGISKEARRALAGRATRVRPAHLWEVVLTSLHAHVRQNALRVLAETGKWESAPYLVRACALADLELAEMADHLLANWTCAYNRVQVPPAAEQLATLAAAIDEATGSLPGPLMEHLHFVVRSTRPPR